jgi:hypothetical protein
MEDKETPEIYHCNFCKKELVKGVNIGFLAFVKIKEGHTWEQVCKKCNGKYPQWIKNKEYDFKNNHGFKKSFWMDEEFKDYCVECGLIFPKNEMRRVRKTKYKKERYICDLCYFKEINKISQKREQKLGLEGDCK